MKLSDVPDLAAFEQHAQTNPSCPDTQETYQAVLMLFEMVQTTDSGRIPSNQEPTDVRLLTRQCAVIEEATRLIWACAAATGHINPPIWEDAPLIEDALDYFHGLDDGEWMAQTNAHRIRWDMTPAAQPAPQS